MLGSKNRRGHKDSHLLLGADALEGRTHGHFCFAESHIAADQTVHRPPAFHVPLDIFSSLHLVRRKLVFEGVFELLLELSVGRKTETFHQFAAGVQFHKFPGNLHHLLLDTLLDGVPVFAAQLVQLGRFLFGNIQAVNLLQV